jgi:hypothetical protein
MPAPLLTETTIRPAGLWLAALLCLCLLSPAWANGYDLYPAPLAWDPCGQKLLALPPDSSGNSQEVQLIYSANPAMVVPLSYGNEVASPCWAPDGLRAAVVIDGRLTLFSFAQTRIDMDAGLPRPVRLGSPISNTNVLDCAFNPLAGQSGEPLLFFSAGERFYGADLFALFDDGTVRTIAGSDSDDSFISPVPLEDGSLLFLHMSMSGDRAYERIYGRSSSEPNGRQLTAPASGPPISPSDYHECYASPLRGRTGREIVFQRGGWGDWQLLSLNLDSGTESLLLADAQQPSLSRDGNWLAYTHVDPAAKAEAEYDWELPGTVWLAELDGEPVRQLSSAQASSAAYPALAPQGSRVAWVEYLPGEAQGVVRMLELGY